MPTLILPSLSLSLCVISGALRSAPAALLDDKGPQVGSVAPEPGLRAWIQRDGAPGLTLESLRGRVVLLHLFAWNCSSCLRIGIPLVVDLLEANEDRGLSVLSVTTPAYAEETKEVLARFGVRHPVGTENPFTNSNPYVDASVNPITYVFVIGRNGNVAWRGDPSKDLDECLQAVAHALDQPADRALARPLHLELAEAVQLYFAGEWRKARKTAERISKKHGRSSKSESATIATDAEYLLQRIAGLGDALLAELEGALEARDEERIARVRHELAILLPKSETSRRADVLLARLDEDESLAESVESAESWRQVAAARPALFPIRADKTVTKYVKQLRRFVKKNNDDPHRTNAESWIASWELLHGKR